MQLDGFTTQGNVRVANFRSGSGDVLELRLVDVGPHLRDGQQPRIDFASVDSLQYLERLDAWFERSEEERHNKATTSCRCGEVPVQPGIEEGEYRIVLGGQGLEGEIEHLWNVLLVAFLEEDSPEAAFGCCRRAMPTGMALAEE